MSSKVFLLFFWMVGSTTSIAQIPFEVFAGNQRVTTDVLFFKTIKKKGNQSSPWLFFNRDRVTIDYRQTDSTYLPTFSTTTALSFTAKKAKGFAPVLLYTISSQNMEPKAGMQYAHLGKQFTVFTWLVSEWSVTPQLDYFLLCRYTPTVNERLNGFVQLESFNGIPTASNAPFQLVLRGRLGVQCRSFQVGFGLDHFWLGRASFTQFNNAGVFIRYEF